MALRVIESIAPSRHRNLRRVPFSVVQSTVAVGGTSTQSAAFAHNTTLVTVQSDEACHVAFGANPTATTDHYKLSANNGFEADFEVTAGHKVAVIQA